MSTEERAVEMVKGATMHLREEAMKRSATSKMGVVRCNDFRCLAVMGRDGVWRDGRRRALAVVEVIAEF